MIMKPFFISLSVLFAVITTASSQSKLVFRDKFMYSDTQIFHAKKEFTISSLIDTGCSLCILDSIFAIDSCGIKENTLETIYVNQNRTKISSTIIDSLFFCGKIYTKVHCLVADLSVIYQKYAPKFIIGANILKQGAWKFDMEKSIIEPYDCNKKVKGVVYKWKNHRHYSDVAIDYIVLEGKVGKKNTRFIFDTGCRNNKLQLDIYDGPKEIIQKESADIGNKLSIKTELLCRNVKFKIGKDDFILDFIIGNNKLGLLNIEFLQGHSFILNYHKQILEVL